MIRPTLISLTLFASVAGAQQALPPVRPLGPVLATSTEALASVSQVRALPGGRVIVHDLTGRRVLLFDSTFKNFTLIADSTSATANAYGSRLGGLVSFRGDSTLFVDPQSMSMLVIDQNGKIVRTMAAPLPNEVGALIGGPNGTPGFDPMGRLVYRAQVRFAPNTSKAGGPGMVLPNFPDSSFIVRVDLKSRKVDTAATFRIPKQVLNITQTENGGMMITTTVNPMPWTDDWAMLSDGSVAIVRGQDYRVDLVSPDGAKIAGSKMAFDWQRLTDEDKMKIIDSARTAMEKQRQAMMAQMSGGDPKAAAADTTKAGGRQRPVGDGGGNMVIQMGAAGGGAPGGMPRGGISVPPLNFVPINEMPDYRPAFRQGAARGDADGNLWIRTSKTVNGGTVYDVVSNKGELRDRILIPPGRVIAGWGPGGVVYMGVVDGSITRLERARVTAPAAAVGNK